MGDMIQIVTMRMHPFITFANVCLVLLLVTQVHKADLCRTETRMVCSVFSLTITMYLGEISVKPGVHLVERGCSVVERRIRNQVSPGSNPLCYRFEDWAFSFSSLTPLLTQLYK